MFTSLVATSWLFVSTSGRTVRLLRNMARNCSKVVYVGVIFGTFGYGRCIVRLSVMKVVMRTGEAFSRSFNFKSEVLS